MVNDCALYSQSNSVDYYQFSNVILRSESINNGSNLYVFGQVNSPKKTSFSIPFACLEFKDIYSFQIRVLLKTRTLLYQELRSITTQSIFINEMITSRNSYKSLYIA
ncbi:hypothetical protein DOS84_06180 [Flavobacterium aquariorum]|uniref:Uncharacterized protein n=2 Tax=Flavobacterium TaxID=237 RepID=A0A2W7TVX4_9FLAO|nr:hypothetical protein DOS84_06180 [Flavobacterium aquariorum]